MNKCCYTIPTLVSSEGRQGVIFIPLTFFRLITFVTHPIPQWRDTPLKRGLMQLISKDSKKDLLPLEGGEKKRG